MATGAGGGNASNERRLIAKGRMLPDAQKEGTIVVREDLNEIAYRLSQG